MEKLLREWPGNPAAVGRAAVCMVCGASRAPDAVDAVRGYTRTRTLATTVALDAVEDH